MNVQKQDDQDLVFKQTEQENGKRPMALAITLVLLVICMIFVILFATLSIGNKQEFQVVTGDRIVESFKQLDQTIDQTIEGLDYVIVAPLWNEDKRYIITQISYSLHSIESEVALLLDIAASTEHDAYTEVSQTLVTEWLQPGFELINKLTIDEQQLTEEDRLQLVKLKEDLQQVDLFVEQFNYKLEGNRNAMIRLSNGFEWIELMEAIKAFIK